MAIKLVLPSSISRGKWGPSRCGKGPVAHQLAMRGYKAGYFHCLDVFEIISGDKMVSLWDELLAVDAQNSTSKKKVNKDHEWNLFVDDVVFHQFHLNSAHLFTDFHRSFYMETSKKRGMVVKHHHRALWLCLFLLWRIREPGVLFAGPGRVTRDTPGIGRWLQVLESVQGASAFLSETLKKSFVFC